MMRFLLLAGALLLSPALLAAGQQRYISDNVFIYLHNGPGTQYRILGSIEAGQPVQFLGETQDDYSKVIDHKGREGWVANDMLSNEPSLRERMPQLETELASVKEQLANLEANQSDAGSRIENLQTQLKQAEDALAKANQERDSAMAKVNDVQDNARYRMWQEGGLIAAIGALIGIILVYLPRPQRRKKNRWM
ncbi:TIGR04211 family SH3 domain-containing protein [Shewanella cyperi]|uniref:TIGR04211 family SH3 domain-containing protein n=1 Tax=Shewanella cyperi TaxID=2814292 RepID=UPI00396A20EF